MEQAKKVLWAAMLALVTISAVGCYVPHRSYSNYEYRRSDGRRYDPYDRQRDRDRWRHDRGRRYGWDRR
jgi:hypothetical protein